MIDFFTYTWLFFSTVGCAFFFYVVREQRSTISNLEKSTVLMDEELKKLRAAVAVNSSSAGGLNGFDNSEILGEVLSSWDDLCNVTEEIREDYNECVVQKVITAQDLEVFLKWQHEKIITIGNELNRLKEDKVNKAGKHTETIEDLEFDKEILKTKLNLYHTEAEKLLHCLEDVREWCRSGSRGPTEQDDLWLVYQNIDDILDSTNFPE